VQHADDNDIGSEGGVKTKCLGGEASEECVPAQATTRQQLVRRAMIEQTNCEVN
jgi:hypothetical protein